MSILSSIKKIGVIGAGQMGNGISQVVAQAGFAVVLYDVRPASLDEGLRVISISCDRLIKKNSMSEEQKKSILQGIKTTTQISDLADCDFIIEAATENVELKLNIFRQLDEIVKKSAILASNTSSISLTRRTELLMA